MAYHTVRTQRVSQRCRRSAGGLACFYDYVYDAEPSLAYNEQSYTDEPVWLVTRTDPKGSRDRAVFPRQSDASSLLLPEEIEELVSTPVRL